MSKNLEQLLSGGIEIINNSKNIYIGSHINPDGDNIGSLLALGMALKEIGKTVHILKVDNIPKDYQFLPNVHLISKPTKDEKIDLFIALDCSDLDRLGSGKEIALKADKILNIDHHITNDNFGHINIVSSSASSTGEMVYYLIKELNIPINKDIAECLYVAISSDTGSFMYDNTSSNTHRVAADLLDKGINLNSITTQLYQNRSLERTQLFIESLRNLNLYYDGKVGTIKITQKMLEDNEATMEDTEGIISFIRDIENVEVACVLKEYDNKEIKLSLRSKKYLDVSKVCLEFNGGGHKRAAGCTIFKDIGEAEESILNSIKGYLR